MKERTSETKDNKQKHLSTTNLKKKYINKERKFEDMMSNGTPLFFLFFVKCFN